MMWTTTGNLTNVKANAKFPFGVAMLPAHKRRGSPTGGGNFYISKKASAAEQQAAFAFIKWATSPERAAQLTVNAQGDQWRHTVTEEAFRTTLAYLNLVGAQETVRSLEESAQRDRLVDAARRRAPQRHDRTD